MVRPATTVSDGCRLHIGRQSSRPHTAPARADVDAHCSCIRPSIWYGSGNGPGGAFEKLQQRGGNEAGPRSIHMPIALVVLPMGEEALRNHKMQTVFGAGHRDIKK